MHEKRNDDYWNVDSNRSLSDSWKGFTKFTLLKEKSPKGYMRSGRECPDVWIRLPRHKWTKTWANIEDYVALPERNLYGHPLAGLLWERQFEEVLLGRGREKRTKLVVSVCSSETKIVLVGLRA